MDARIVSSVNGAGAGLRPACYPTYATILGRAITPVAPKLVLGHSQTKRSQDRLWLVPAILGR